MSTSQQQQREQSPPAPQTHGDPDKPNSAHQRSRSKDANAGKGTSKTRVCRKCQQNLTGQFVRALGCTYHLDCFRCQDCGQTVATKFFPVDEENGTDQYPLCETDYFRRLDLLCHECGGALRGSYITAVDRKYHIEHFTCSVCPTIFGAQDSYYEHDGKVYCHYHYSTHFAERCNGCDTAILKQFVEIFRNGQNQHWHPECYMIQKFWNVKLARPDQNTAPRPLHDSDATAEERALVREEEDRMEEKVFKIWRVLSTFEELSAACISDMLLHVSNGAYVDGVIVANRFISYVDVLFQALDRLDLQMTAEGMKGIYYGREAKLLCKKIVAFFSLLSKTQDTGVRKLGVTQELLSLVTGLAHYLKLLVRISLQAALKFEREKQNSEGLKRFLEELDDLEATKDEAAELPADNSVLAGLDSDLCLACKGPIEDECAKLGISQWHLPCLNCTNCGRELGRELQNATWSVQTRQILCQTCAAQAAEVTVGFEHNTKLQQYVFLLRVALARLLSKLRAGGILPHTSDDPNLARYDSNEGHRVSTSNELEPPMLRSNTRSKSYGGVTEEHPDSAYSQQLGDIRRLRSTRMDKPLSSTSRKARRSRIIDGPEGSSTRPGSSGANGYDLRKHNFQIIEDRDANGEVRPELTFGNQDALTLDDIPRIVAAEQAKEQRPNAYKHAKTGLVSPSNRIPRLVNGHQRDVSGGKELEKMATGEPTQRVKKYFSELSGLEYFIVRHVAVLSMGPLVEEFFNLEELLGLIESRKPTFWGKFGKAFKNDSKKVSKKKGVFGVSLDTLVERDPAESTFGVGPGALRVPGLLDDAVSAMRQMDMSVEGVFRKNGNIRRLKELADAIDKDGGEGVDLSKESPVQVAALLKKFLRELPDPLLTFKLHRLFIASQKISDAKKRRRVLHLTCCLLPKAHRDSMEILFSFLHWAASFSHVDEESGSKMDIHNLATVITPNILYSTNKNSGVEDSFLAIEAVHSLIECNETMCEVPEDLQSILNDSSLFNGSAEITTKEILKRYGALAKPSPGDAHGEKNAMSATITGPSAADAVAAPATTGNSTASTPLGKEGRGSVPIAATRVETNPSQETAWQKESLVRHVHGPGAGTGAGAGAGAGAGTGPVAYPPSNHNTPPQAHHEFVAWNSPQHQQQQQQQQQRHQRSHSTDSQNSPGATTAANRSSHYSPNAHASHATTAANNGSPNHHNKPGPPAFSSSHNHHHHHHHQQQHHHHHHQHQHQQYQPYFHSHASPPPQQQQQQQYFHLPHHAHPNAHQNSHPNLHYGHRDDLGISNGGLNMEKL